MAINLRKRLKRSEMKIFRRTFHRDARLKYALRFKLMKLCVTAGQIVSAPWEADVEQLPHPQQQMRVYNWTRQWNNRDSVCYETSTNTKSFCSGREQVQRGSWSHQISGWCKGGVGVQLLQPKGIISNSVLLYLSSFIGLPFVDTFTLTFTLFINLSFSVQLFILFIQKYVFCFVCACVCDIDAVLLLLLINLDLNYEWGLTLGDVLIKSMFCKLDNHKIKLFFLFTDWWNASMFGVNMT